MKYIIKIFWKKMYRKKINLMFNTQTSNKNTFQNLRIACQ